MKAFTVSLLFLFSTSAYLSAAPLQPIEAAAYSQNEQVKGDWNPLISIQSTTKQNIAVTNGQISMALLAGALFALLIVSRRAQYSKG
ncbi:hypothetical protein MLD52_05570 [Puniceicoccaceae bacterium K14]|nr:hypothetical protein [Puniceicoccaceae bacterium K14]